MRTSNYYSRPPSDGKDSRAEALEELRKIRTVLEAIREIADEFFGTLLNAKFKYGQPIDRWKPNERFGGRAR